MSQSVEPVGFSRQILSVVLLSAAKKREVRMSTLENLTKAAEVLRELDRLYRLRFEIADREKAGVDCKKELRIYGEQKKSAWQQSAIVLAAIDKEIQLSTPEEEVEVANNALTVFIKASKTVVTAWETLKATLPPETKIAIVIMHPQVTQVFGVSHDEPTKEELHRAVETM